MELFTGVPKEQLDWCNNLTHERDDSSVECDSCGEVLPWNEGNATVKAWIQKHFEHRKRSD